MPGYGQSAPFICARCLFRQHQVPSPIPIRHFRTQAPHLSSAQPQPAKNGISETDAAEDGPPGGAAGEREKGAMSRRLEEMTNESLESNPRRAQKMVEESGFSEELKARLESRIAEGKIKAENPAAFAELDMPSSAGQGTREQAAAQPWLGAEQLGDAALRMLDDAHKKLGPGNRGKPKMPSMSVDMRMKQAVKQSASQRLANARDKTSVYALSQDKNMSEKEKEEFRKVLHDRFKPGGRPMPQSIQGLQSLASERIEDAIARGLFKNIPRGKGVNVERDHTASSPFLDTTEYFMNKIIQKQEVLPPWVEKQQEVTRQSAQFRSRLRNDWKRHAARSIASKGGTLEQQIRRAEAYAKAEEEVNPRKVKEETMTTIDTTGAMKRVTVTEAPAQEAKQGAEITVTEATTSPEDEKTITVETTSTTADTASAEPPASQSSETPPAPYPFRDPTWEKTELSYHTLALNSLNSLTRSYNLMAPELAKKPYFSLQRELKACFAEIAPLLPNEIKERARAPPTKAAFQEIGHRKGGVMEKFGGQRVKVYESTKPQYGFKEFWQDLFGKKGA